MQIIKYDKQDIPVFEKLFDIDTAILNNSEDIPYY